VIRHRHGEIEGPSDDRRQRHEQRRPTEVQHPEEIGGQLDAIAFQDLAYRERQRPSRDRQRHAADGDAEGPGLLQVVAEDLIFALDQLVVLERQLGVLRIGRGLPSHQSR